METREDIEKQHEQYKSTLSGDFRFFEEEKFKKISRFLLAAGGVIIGYFVVRKLFLTSRKERKANVVDKQAQIATHATLGRAENLSFMEILKNGIAAILLGIAKQKIEGILGGGEVGDRR